MRIDAPDDLAACSLMELQRLSAVARELDISAQVELRRRDQAHDVAERHARIEHLGPVAKRLALYLDSGSSRGGRWSFVALAVLVVMVINIPTLITVGADFLQRVEDARAKLHQQEQTK